MTLVIGRLGSSYTMVMEFGDHIMVLVRLSGQLSFVEGFQKMLKHNCSGIAFTRSKTCPTNIERVGEPILYPSG